MKALSLTQPWATLIANGSKRIETRSWPTNYRGPIAIHAAKNLSPVGGKTGLRVQCGTPPFDYHLLQWRMKTGLVDLPLGAIVAVADLVSCEMIDMKFRSHVMANGVAPNEIDFGDYTSGRYAWFLSDVKALSSPIECGGMQGLWNVTLPMERKILARADVVEIAKRRPSLAALRQEAGMK